MQIVAGLSLKNLKPRVWDPLSPYYLPELQAVMVSYADFHQQPAARRQALQQGLRAYLGVPPRVRIYLDNGAFYFLRHEGELAREEYEAFVAQARPDWYPIAQDFIPTPQMTEADQQACFERTMASNRAYRHDGFVPVIHVSQMLDRYTAALRDDPVLEAKPALALGGIVPNLLRTARAMPYDQILRSLRTVRQEFADKTIHVFGMGGTATMHLAALFQIDSADSSGWRNRAARGLVQLPGRGDRLLARMGSWRGREPTDEELRLLAACPCPACQAHGLAGLRASGIDGFCNRATHNLWTILRELAVVERQLAQGTYASWYEAYLHNSTYLPLIRQALAVILNA